MVSDRSISVEVAYAGPTRLFLRRVTLPAGSTVADAIERSGFGDAHPEIAVSDRNVGVFSRKVGLGHTLSDDDRVEIYRPLLLTPNEARKLRAQRKGAVRRRGRVSPQADPGDGER
ncbi:MAG: RnfH family protein [Proteobacteria bacterium]|nr:MAG: RnfH family protein [Pseudomonadota bacterium]